MNLLVSALVDDLISRGVVLEATPTGRLRFGPKSALKNEDIEQLREHKEEIVRLISRLPENAVTAVTPVMQGDKADTYGKNGSDSNGDSNGDSAVTPPAFVTQAEAEATERAAELGLVACWSREFGYVAIHDPVSGEWHDIPTKQAPAWAGREAHKRKELYKINNVRSMFTRAELEEVYQRERAAAEPEGIIEDYPLGE